MAKPAVEVDALQIGKGVDVSRAAVGSPFRVSYTMPVGSSQTVEVKIRKAGDVAWTDLSMSEVDMPSGHRRVYEATYVPTAVGWYYLSFKDSTGGWEDTKQFYAYRLEVQSRAHSSVAP
jgi:hypothetical protein